MMRMQRISLPASDTDALQFWMLDSPRRVRQSQDVLPAAICAIRV